MYLNVHCIQFSARLNLRNIKTTHERLTCPMLTVGDFIPVKVSSYTGKLSVIQHGGLNTDLAFNIIGVYLRYDFAFLVYILIKVDTLCT